MRIWWVALATVLIGGCHIGPQPSTYRLAQQAAGAESEIEMSHGTMTAELLDVRDSAIVVLNLGAVVLVPYAAIVKASFNGVDGNLSGGRAPPLGLRSDMRTVSRYPQGLSPALEEKLLAAYHQSSDDPRAPMSVRSAVASIAAVSLGLAGGTVPGFTQAAHSALAIADTDSVARFLRTARQSTARYRDQQVAIAEGYAPVGPDFPGMGEHWINLVMVFTRQFDARQPAVLEYATIDGRPTLVGVAYSLPLLAKETAPEFPSVAAWHGHLGTVDEESQLLGQLAEGHGAAAGARLAMLHAWVWTENPAGPWAADNWALPFLRAGLPPPAGAGAVDGRAMSLVSGGDRYFIALFEAKAGGSRADSAMIREAVSAAARSVRAFVEGHRSRPVTADDLAALRAIWRAMWTTMERGAAPDVRAKLAAMAAELSD